MYHDPTLIKPYADYHRRTMADDHYDRKLKPLVLINARKPKRQVPPPRSWKVNQVIPVVKRGLASNPTNVVWMLNMSNLPTSATPKQCLLWVETFLESLNALNDRDEAAELADKAVERSS